MAKYSRFRYSQATYGGAPSVLGYSVAPLNAFVYNYEKGYGRIELSWVQPTGTFTQMRIVRNQDAFPETAEDGIIVYDAVAPISDLYTDDVSTDPYAGFVPGKFVYYRAWLRKTDNVWYPAGDAYTLVPIEHSTRTSKNTVRTSKNLVTEQLESENADSSSDLVSTHDKLVDLLPRVFSSTAESPLDAVNSSSVIYRFLGAFAATLDESLTFADLLKPDRSGHSANPNTLALAANQYGLTPDPFLATKSQKRMLGETRYIFSRKGTFNALDAMVESITGYAPSFNISPNIFTSIQDSSFYKGVGFWKASGTSTIAALETNTAVAYNVPTTERLAIDLAWVGEATIATGGDSLSNGASNVFTQGIPVYENADYVFSYYVKGAGDVTPEITWYDNLGAVIDSPEAGAGITAVNTGWTKDDSLTATAPAGATFASLKLTFDTAGTYYLDMMQLALSGITDYEEARAVSILIAPNKINYIKNPSFERWTGATLEDWTTDGTVSKEATSLSLVSGETYMLELTTNNGTTSLTTTADSSKAIHNAFYTFSVYMEAPAGDETFTITLTADDGVGTPFVYTSAPFTVTDSWARYHGTFRIPSTFTSSSLTITAELSGTTTGNVVNIDNAQLENSYNPTDYFDGSLGYANGAIWNGVEHGSASYLYVNRISKYPRLIAELPNYLPMNTPYSIYSYYGLEYKTVT